MRIERDIKLDFDDVLIKPNRSTLSSRADVNLLRTFRFYHSPKELTCLPVMCSNLSSVAGLEMAKALQKYRMITCLHKYIDYEEVAQEKNKGGIDLDYTWLTIGMSDVELEKLKVFSNWNGLEPNITVDSANGHMDSFVKFCAKIRNEFPLSIIMAGNVAASECAQELIIHGGVDIVKGGIGPGRFCLTRKVTGVGYPQLSNIIECSSVVHGLKSEDKRLGLFCSDGGCKEVSDICKGFGAGSDFIMLGGMFSGAEECCGEWYISQYNHNLSFLEYIVVKNKRAYVSESLLLKTYGMSSQYAQQKFANGDKEYRASEGEECVYVPYKGPVDGIVKQICGGLRSCCTYVGAENLKDLPKCTVFLLCNRQK